ncbi:MULTISPECIES: hypothetical protein [Rhizobium]|uniref:hypothetical protein n=1 Tax=Rhizobium TaxID=379 RepID=UPI0010391C27|nr:hypothetical protein [Rhizobium leguminosarum]MBY5796314.1 hypothetical protein [Rhizobium leguminosarum]TBZ98529.1 hypothetical protein E0H57_30775 [Rhizobium leguminosarum bv. viciae]UFW79052.1 hypothetical protein RlegSU303_03710 [Rhizobium leguminosarum bv. viciae]
MDLQSLVAAHMPNRRRPTQMGASVEDRYYRNQITLPRLRLRLLGLIATTAGAALLLAGVIQA